MFSTLLLALIVLGTPTAGAPRAQDSGSAPAFPIQWHSGPLDELVARARSERKPLFVDFTAPWCAPCRQMERTVFVAPAVAAELARFTCARLDVDTEPGKALVERFRARTIPRLVFLDPDGAPREALTGAYEAGPLAAELARIARDERTIGAERRAADAAPANLELRAALARHLREFGDVGGYERELARLRELDPQRASLSLRRLEFEQTLEALQRAVDTEPLRAFLAVERHAELLHEGWRTVAAAERLWVQRKRDEHDERGALHHYTLALAAERRAWPHTPAAQVVALGGNLAWEIYERRADLPADYVPFALDVARQVVAASAASPGGLDANVLDTQACLLHASGDVEGARAAVRRCIALAPQEELYQQRLREFGG
jgi:thioredoxin-like negative regulator of GroEL